MKPAELRRLLASVRTGKTSAAEAAERLRAMPVIDVGFARLDGHREARCGMPEVVLGIGKSPAQIARIVKELSKRSTRVLVTRATREAFDAVHTAVPAARYEETARAIVVRRERARPRGSVVVVSAGTADIPVAEEARVTAELMGARVETLFDCGVAGLHRTLAVVPKLRKARAIVVVAGMDGALAAVVAGLVPRPVIAVPTSIGYGASFEGVAPLLTMMSSCAAGVAVVNIDNGFGAGYLAAMINAG
ncbi:MAG TPA: nickel pincer cofactor biosynthesis protein LarB [Planctomycetota bacterium]|nr:nickel pincer cofactor biosynthesis protein LarB [Planctomycetota bacterium]